MARKPRRAAAGSWHHVMNRGARHQPIYLSDGDRRSFVGLMRNAFHHCGVEIHAYALMGNHFHLLLYCPSGELSKFMHRLSGMYTQRFNREHGFDGPLFKERFKSVRIESDEQLLWVSRYIHRNPLDLPGVTEAGLVDFPWSSYGDYSGRRRRPAWLATELVLAMMADYQRFVESDETAPIAREGASDPTKSHEKIPVPSPPPATLDDIESAVAKVADVDPADLLVGTRGRPNVPRNLALMLAVEVAAEPNHVLAQRYGMSGATSVWSTVSRTRTTVATNDQVHKLLRAVRHELSQLN